MCLFKQIFRLVLPIPLLFAFLWSSTSFAESLGDSVPKGNEVKDPYLEKLFAPEFPFETIKNNRSKRRREICGYKGERKCD